MKTKDYVIIGLSMVALLLLFRPTKTLETVDTVLLRDTFFDTITILPSPPKIIERWRDTIIYVDSSTAKPTDNGIAITMPLNKYTFEEMGKYKFELEGIAVKPIRFELIQPTISNTVTNNITKQKRFNWGVFGGVGAIYGTKGMDVGIVVGVGLQYKF